MAFPQGMSITTQIDIRLLLPDSERIEQWLINLGLE